MLIPELCYLTGTTAVGLPSLSLLGAPPPLEKPFLLLHLLADFVALEGGLDLHGCLVHGWVTRVSWCGLNGSWLLLMLLWLPRWDRGDPNLCTQGR